MEIDQVGIRSLDWIKGKIYVLEKITFGTLASYLIFIFSSTNLENRKINHYG